jgi:predicted O-methyltransferase YrrM
MDHMIFSEVDHYISNLLAYEDQALIQASKRIQSENIPDASISPNQGKLLQVFAMACQAKKVLELGTLGAYSTIWMAKAIPDDGKVITIECDKHHAEVAQKNIDNTGLSHKIDLRLGKALDILPSLIENKEGPFDLIFIDADKPPYTEYFKFALQLARPGSIIVCDNVIRNGQVLDADHADEKVKGVQRLNTFLASCTEVTATILQTVGVKEYDGMVVAVVNSAI